MPPRDIKDRPNTGSARSGTGGYAPIAAVGKRGTSGTPATTIVPTATSSPVPPSQAQLGTFCHYCGDFAGKGYQQCGDCKAIVCQQSTKSTAGCIGFCTVKPSIPFLCPLCSRKVIYNKLGPLPYVHHGFINRKSAKLCWPMCLVHIKLETMQDSYTSEATTLEARHRYSGFNENVCDSTTMRMQDK